MRRFLAIAALFAIGYAAITVLRSNTREPLEATISVADALRSDTTGYERAVFPADIRFPEDHGAHPDFKTEWWYYTGNLASDEGRSFGYQFTVFRTALAPPGDVAKGGSLRSGQLFTAHFAVTDPESGSFYFSERTSRGAAGLAGGVARPFAVWLEDWEVRQTGADPMQSRLLATAEGYAVNLRLAPSRAPLLQGFAGFSPKDRDSTNASYYYSYTRLETSGTLVVGRDTFEVDGQTWMDHEWSTSALGPTQVGWDWFALRLSDETDLMYFQVRERSGEWPFVEGTLRESDGSVTRLSSESVRLTVTETWDSPSTGVTYPSGWTLVLPGLDLTLDVRPVMPNQEVLSSVRYWEGAVLVEGRRAGAAVTGAGYVELTGYGDDPTRTEP